MVYYNCALNTIALVFCVWSALLHIALRSHGLNLYRPPQTPRPPHCQARTEKTVTSWQGFPLLLPSAVKAASPHSQPLSLHSSPHLGGSRVVLMSPPSPTPGTSCHQVSLLYLDFLLFLSSLVFVYLHFQLFLSLLAFQPRRMLKSSHSFKKKKNGSLNPTPSLFISPPQLSIFKDY